MAPKQPSWRQVALALGSRMRHYAGCPHHDRTEADSDNCPFCADRAAYDMFRDKLDHRPRHLGES